MWQRYADLLGEYTPALVGHCVERGIQPFLLVERVIELWRMPERVPRLWADRHVRLKLLLDACRIVDALADARLLWADFKVANFGVRLRATRPMLVIYDLSSLKKRSWQPRCSAAHDCVHEMVTVDWPYR